MAGILEYSSTPASNTTINGIGISGGSSVKYGDDAIRQFMADVRSAVTKSSDKAAGTHMATKADHNQLWRVTGNATINLTAAATLTAGWALWVMADGGTVTIDPASSEQINGASTLTIQDGAAAFIICTATAFRALPIGTGDMQSATWAPKITASLKYVGAIGASEDLDTYTTPGVYVQNQNAGASGGSNYPTPLAGMLEVLDGDAATNVQTVQRYTDYNNPPLTYYRMQRSSGTWSAWQEVITQSNLPPSTPPSNKRIITSSTTWDKPDGLTKVIVTVIGAGGGAGRKAGTGFANSGYGGAGGGASIKEITAADLGATESIVVGAGGIGRTGSAGSGAAGGTSSFGSHLSASGGSGGPNTDGSSSAVPGGIGTGGDINLRGGQGGGNLYMGTAALLSSGAVSNANAPPNTGAGGVSGGASDTNGYNGGSGLVIIEEYF